MTMQLNYGPGYHPMDPDSSNSKRFWVENKLPICLLFFGYFGSVILNIAYYYMQIYEDGSTQFTYQTEILWSLGLALGAFFIGMIAKKTYLRNTEIPENSEDSFITTIRTAVSAFSIIGTICLYANLLGPTIFNMMFECIAYTQAGVAILGGLGLWIYSQRNNIIQSMNAFVASVKRGPGPGLIATIFIILLFAIAFGLVKFRDSDYLIEKRKQTIEKRSNDSASLQTKPPR